MTAMTTRQELRAEETRGAILAAAGQLFAAQGYDSVTMREIAKAAGCSHTTIYIYFKDKEALLHHLSVGPLQALRDQMATVLLNQALSPDDRLREISRLFIGFCLRNRTMYTVFFMAKATRVDVEPSLEFQQLRNQLFGLLRQGIQSSLHPSPAEEMVLAYARTLFFTLHGIIGTYTGSEEPYDELMGRLAPTFELAVDVLLAGFKQTMHKGAKLR